MINKDVPFLIYFKKSNLGASFLRFQFAMKEKDSSRSILLRFFFSHVHVVRCGSCKVVKDVKVMYSNTLGKIVSQQWHTWWSNVQHWWKIRIMFLFPHAIWFVHWWTWKRIWMRSTRFSMLLFFFMLTMFVMPPETGACLLIFMNKLHDFCTSSSLEVNWPRRKSTTFGCNKRQLNQEAFDLDKDKTEIAHEYKYLGVDF